VTERASRPPLPGTGPPPPPVLVLGVGSELRSDDAVGRHVAAAIAALGLPGVEVRSVQQLTPEVALDLVDRSLVVVVDAAVEVEQVQVGPVTAGPSRAALSHRADLAELLATTSLFGTPPHRVMSVRVPVQDLAIGTELAPATAGRVGQVVEIVCGLVREVPARDRPRSSSVLRAGRLR
jgi:hydrogenase maturation protease